MKPRHLLYLTILFVIVGWTIATVQGNAAVSVGDHQQSLPLTLRAPLPTFTPSPTPTPPATPVPPPAGTYGLITDGDTLYRINADGTTMTLLAEYPDSTIVHTEWSPDGTAFVAVTPREGSSYYFSFYLYRRDGTFIRAGDFTFLTSLRWSQDGRWLFYLNTSASNTMLYQIDVYTNVRVQRGDNHTRDYALSSDSQRLAWTQDYRNTDIYIAPLASGTLQEILYNGKYVKAWLANNSRLLVLRHNGEYENTGTWHIIWGGLPDIDLGAYTTISAIQPSLNGNRLAYARDNAITVIASDSGITLNTISSGGAEATNLIEWSPDDRHLLYESDVTVGGNPVAALTYASLDSSTPTPQRIGTALLNGEWRDNNTISYSQLRPVSNGYACDPILFDVPSQTTRPLLPPSDACWQVLDWVTVP